MIVISYVFPRIHDSPLEAVTGAATCGAILSGLMSIFIDRSPWPGILLFWLGLSSLLIVPV
jgi:hypothetical protein